jgi:ADP-heptose:LPS heptosyltransferase
MTFLSFVIFIPKFETKPPFHFKAPRLPVGEAPFKIDEIFMRNFSQRWQRKEISETRRLKILSIQLRSLGDAVVSIPALVAIRDQFPDCELHALVTAAAAPLLRNHPVLDRVWELERKRGKMNLRHTLCLLRILRAERFDRLVDIGGDDRSAIFSFFSGVRERLGVVNQSGFWGRRFCYTRRVAAPARDRHETLRLLDVLRPWGILPPKKIEIQLYPDAGATFYVPRDESRRLVICHAGAGCTKKMWPASHWAQLHELTSLRGYELLFTHGIAKRDQEFMERLRQLSPEIRILPRLDLPHLLVALKSADAVISNDTGPMHFAAGLGIRTVAIFGSSPPERWSPIGPAVRILKAQNCICERYTHKCRRPDDHCMAGISPEIVLDNLERLFCENAVC